VLCLSSTCVQNVAQAQIEIETEWLIDHLPTPGLAYCDDQVEARPHEAISATQLIIIHHSSFIIHHSSFIIHHSSFIIHHSSFIIATSSSLASLLTFKP
jgi:hypothetical protein